MSPGSAGGLWGGPHTLLHQKPEWVSVLSVQPNFTNDLSTQTLPFSPGKGYEQKSQEKQVLLQGQNESTPTCGSLWPSEICLRWPQASPSHRSHPGVCPRSDRFRKYTDFSPALPPYPGLCRLLSLTHSTLLLWSLHLWRYSEIPGHGAGELTLGGPT